MNADDRAGFGAVTDYLFGLKPRGSKFGIDRMRLLTAALGHPERGLRCVHVAGTNGKGSVSAMLESILRTAGWRVGLYTSPHLVHVGERVQVDRVRLPSEEVTAFVRELDPIADQVAREAGADDRPSFFEYLTAMALLKFQREGCDIAVLEVGLGGALDATNIVEPEVSVITSIGFDHCEYLGRTLPEIARAKAGIIKPGRPVVIGRLPAEAEETIRGIAAERSATVHAVAEIYEENAAPLPTTSLEGGYQRENAATAALAARVLGERWRLDAPTIARGLMQVSWPGRWQSLSIGGRTVILDASHNPDGAAVLDRNLAQLVAATGRRPVMVVGVLGAERAKPLLAAIARHAGEICFVVPPEPRACSYEELERLWLAVAPTSTLRPGRTSIEAVFPRPDCCALGAPETPVVVTGSIYLLGAAMARLGLSA